MLFNKLVRPVANTVSKIPARSTSAVAGARSRHVSTLEKTVLVSAMISGILFTPAWVLLHLQEYKGGNKEE